METKFVSVEDRNSSMLLASASTAGNQNYRVMLLGLSAVLSTFRKGTPECIEKFGPSIALQRELRYDAATCFVVIG